MNRSFNYIIKSKADISVDFNNVLRNTYMLLSSTIFFSAIIAFLGIKFNFGNINFILTLFLFIGLLYLINMFKTNILGLILVFVFTGFTGLVLAPTINSILYLKHGEEIVVFSMLLAGFLFFFLSFYVLISKKNFDFLKGFIFIGSIAVLICIIFAFFFNIPLLHVSIAGVIVILSSAYILYETSNILNGNETNYILATINLYMQIYNIFVSLLRIFAFFFDSKD